MTEAELRALKQCYTEVERKRAVHRGFTGHRTQEEIDERAQDLELAYEVLSTITRKRERRKQWRESLSHTAIWLGLALAFLFGLVARPWFDKLLSSLLS